MAGARRKVTKRPPRRKPTNIVLPADLAARAKALGINLSAVSAQAIERAVHEAETRRWQEENDEAFEYANAHFSKHGLFADQWRKF